MPDVFSEERPRQTRKHMWQCAGDWGNVDQAQGKVKEPICRPDEAGHHTFIEATFLRFEEFSQQHPAT